MSAEAICLLENAFKGDGIILKTLTLSDVDLQAGNVNILRNGNNRKMAYWDDIITSLEYGKYIIKKSETKTDSVYYLPKKAYELCDKNMVSQLV